jgi:hypothetical protein
MTSITLNEAREAIYLRFSTNFSGVSSSRVSFENEEFAEPDEGSWVRITIRVIGRGQNTLGKRGNRKFRTKAILYAQVFTEFNTGTQEAESLMKEIADIFEGESFSGVDFTDALQRTGIEDDKWKISNVEAEFDFDEIK